MNIVKKEKIDKHTEENKIPIILLPRDNCYENFGEYLSSLSLKLKIYYYVSQKMRLYHTSVFYFALLALYQCN